MNSLRVVFRVLKGIPALGAEPGDEIECTPGDPEAEVVLGRILDPGLFRYFLDDKVLQVIDSDPAIRTPMRALSRLLPRGQQGLRLVR